MDEIRYKQIGTVYSSLKEMGSPPYQGAFDPDSSGKVEVLPEYAAGIKDLDGFSHIILIYHFHMAKGYELLTEPFFDKQKRGLFSIRYFNRPNPIGLSIVRLDSVNENVLKISEVDIIDGTPLLDIKPYIPDFDVRVNAKTGWYTGPHNNKP